MFTKIKINIFILLITLFMILLLGFENNFYLELGNKVKFNPDIIIKNNVPNKKNKLIIDEETSNKIINIIKNSNIKTNVAKRDVAIIDIFFKGHNIRGLLEGIDPDVESNASQLDKYIIKGDFLNSEQFDSIILNQNIADELKIKIGDQIQYKITNINNKSVLEKTDVIGIFNSNLLDNKDTIVGFINLESFQDNVYKSPLVDLLAINVYNKNYIYDMYKYLKNHIDTSKFNIVINNKTVDIINKINMSIYFIILLLIILYNSIIISLPNKSITSEIKKMYNNSSAKRNIYLKLIKNANIKILNSILIGILIGIFLIYYIWGYGSLLYLTTESLLNIIYNIILIFIVFIVSELFTLSKIINKKDDII